MAYFVKVALPKQKNLKFCVTRNFHLEFSFVSDLLLDTRELHIPASQVPIQEHAFVTELC